MGKGSVHIAEEDNWDEDNCRGELFYVGTFYGHHDVGRVGAEPSNLPRWPPPDRPELVRRRPANERWKDRTDADDPIAWSVAVMLEPADLSVSDPARVEAIADAAGAQSWDDDELQAFEADVAAAVRAAPPDAEWVGWTSGHQRAYRLRFTESAPTRERAAAQALDRCAVPEGWTAEASAEPA